MTETTTRALPFGAITLHRIVAAVYDARDAVIRWNRARRTGEELRRLSREQLDDIGLTPGDVDRILSDRLL